MVVIIPAYEPDEHLIKLIYEFKIHTSHRLVVVNDGSVNSTHIFEKIASKVDLVEHKINKGKGAAMKTGVDYVLTHIPDAEGIVFVDADGQHTLESIDKVIKELVKKSDSIILGSRDFEGDVPFKSRFGNKLTRRIFKCVCGIYLEDTQTGLRAMSITNAKRLLDIRGDRYEYEMNMLMTFAHAGIPIVEIPIATVYEEGKNETTHYRPIADSIKIYKTIISFAFHTLFN